MPNTMQKQEDYNHKRHLQFNSFIVELYETNRYSVCRYCRYNKQCFYNHYPHGFYNFLCDNATFTKFMNEYLNLDAEMDFRRGVFNEKYNPLIDEDPNGDEWKRLEAIWERIKKPEYRDS